MMGLAPVLVRWVLLAASAGLLAGCVFARKGPEGLGGVGGHRELTGFGYGCHCTPGCVVAPARRHGFVAVADGISTGPETVLLCRRVIQSPGGRMAGALGFYHEWIYTPDAEVGLGFVGAEEVGFAGLPQPLTNVLLPMAVGDHAGRIHERDVFVRPVEGVEYGRLVESLHSDRRKGYFPFTNCYLWANAAIRDARRD